MCVSGRFRCRQRDEAKGNRGACGRSAGSIDNAGHVACIPIFYWLNLKKNII